MAVRISMNDSDYFAVPGNPRTYNLKLQNKSISEQIKASTNRDKIFKTLNFETKEEQNETHTGMYAQPTV